MPTAGGGGDVYMVHNVYENEKPGSTRPTGGKGGGRGGGDTTLYLFPTIHTLSEIGNLNSVWPVLQLQDTARRYSRILFSVRHIYKGHQEFSLLNR